MSLTSRVSGDTSTLIKLVQEQLQSQCLASCPKGPLREDLWGAGHSLTGFHKVMDPCGPSLYCPLTPIYTLTRVRCEETPGEQCSSSPIVLFPPVFPQRDSVVPPSPSSSAPHPSPRRLPPSLPAPVTSVHADGPVSQPRGPHTPKGVVLSV